MRPKEPLVKANEFAMNLQMNLHMGALRLSLIGAEGLNWCNIAISVRREKALDHSGMKGPSGNWIAPPGSNRSGGGGNKAVGASGVEGRTRRLGESACCNASER
jgi:hypothetical protein